MIFNIKDKQKNKLYNYLWEDVSEDLITGTFYKGKISENSYCFKKNKNEKTADCLVRNFEIKDKELFYNKFEQACSGDGMEERRITTLHSSSLCALLFFYGVSEKNQLEIEINNRKINFYKSIFEVQNPVIEGHNPSNIDVVLIGKDTKSNQNIILFLESKFAEYYLNSEKSLEISSEYLDEKYSSKKIYDKINEIKGYSLDYNNSKIYSQTLSYIGGIKQMISHYVGVRNAVESKDKFILGVPKENVKIYLGEILFDIDIFNSFFKDYEERYIELSKILNNQLEEDALISKFEVVENLKCYSLFKNSKYNLESKIRKFYFDSIDNKGIK